jgi:peptidylprolyl isomerase
MPPMPRLLLIVFACLALGVAGCGGGDSSSSSSSSSEETAMEKTEAPKQKKVVTKEIEEGSGPAAKAGDQVTVQYVGVNYRSGREFDASWDRGEPFTFTLGVHEVISGWDIGIEGMKVGGRRELIIPPNHAYGASGSPPAIPPNETLVFVVDLEAIN